MTPVSETLTEHDFALELTGVSELTTELENALFEFGCDDATISLRDGRIRLAFTRAGATFADAAASAVRDIRSAGFDVADAAAVAR